MQKILLVLVSVATLACNRYPGSDARTEDLDVVVTQVQPGLDLSGLSTYAITNKVKPISPDGSLPNFELTGELNDLILNTTKDNMNQFGWILVDSTQNPDFALDLGFALTQNTNVYGSYPGYGWGYPGYGWSYPWWGYSTVTSYQVGSIVMGGLDLKNVDTTHQQIPVLWHALIQGPHVNNVKDPDARIVRDINQAFIQSPYLNRN